MSNREELIKYSGEKVINELMFVDNIPQLHYYLIFAIDLLNSHLIEISFIKKFFEQYYTKRKIYKRSNLYNCPIDYCKYNTSNPIKILKHLRDHRTLKLQRTKYLRCKVCGKSYLDEEDLIKHELTHSVKGVYWCEHCGIYWKEKKNRDEHMRIHPDPTPLLHKCILCETEFPTDFRLKIHLNWYHPNQEHKIKYFKKQKEFIEEIIKDRKEMKY